MAQDEVENLPFVYLEMNYEPDTNTVKIIANDLALEFLIDSCQMTLHGIPSAHFHIIKEVNGTIGNLNELIIMKLQNDFL